MTIKKTNANVYNLFLKGILTSVGYTWIWRRNSGYCRIQIWNKKIWFRFFYASFSPHHKQSEQDFDLEKDYVWIDPIALLFIWSHNHRKIGWIRIMIWIMLHFLFVLIPWLYANRMDKDYLWILLRFVIPDGIRI